MAPLIFLLITLALLAGFLAIASGEQKRGTRLFAGTRAELDGKVEHALFIYEHVDFNAFLAEESKALALRLGHTIAHLTLQTVRSAERLLTRLVRHLRSKVAMDSVAPAGETSRPFVQALSGFKEELKAARPQIPEL